MTSPRPGDLMHAVKERDVEHAKILLDRGANPDETNSEGRTVLILAINKSSPEMVQLLITAGADLDKRDADGVTPLMHAVVKNIALLPLLIGNGASVLKTDRIGETALDWARQLGCAKAVEIIEEAAIKQKEINRQITVAEKQKFLQAQARRMKLGHP